MSSQIYKPYFGKNIKPNWIQKLNFFCWHQLHFYGDGLFPRTHSSSKQVLWLYCGALQYLSSPKIEFHIRLWCRFFAKRRGQKTYRIPLGNVSYSIDFHMSEWGGNHSIMLILVCIIPGREKNLWEPFVICLLNSTANSAHFYPSWAEMAVLIKGQLISKCPFVIIVWTKIPTKKFDNFCPRI